MVGTNPFISICTKIINEYLTSCNRADSSESFSNPYRYVLTLNWYLGFGGIACLIVGLVGQAFELRRLRQAAYGDDIGSPNLFTDKRNIKWYAIIGAGIAMWYVAERM